MINGKDHKLGPIKGIRVVMFDCEWQCFCGSILGWKGPMAVVKSIAGAHVLCRSCGQLFQVTTKGALPL